MGCDTIAVDPQIGGVPLGVFDWSVQSSGTINDLSDIYFTSGSTGWVVGNQTILVTSNGGFSWSVPPIDSAAAIPDQLNSVFFISTVTGWMAGIGNDGATGEIFISQQNGAYPTLQQIFDYELNAIFFLDELNGWAAGSKGEIVSTTNGGSTWNNLTNLDPEIFDLQFTTFEKGWAVGAQNGLYHTKDGTNFQLENIEINGRLEGVHFVDTLNGWVCGNRNAIFRRHMSTQNQPVWSSVSIAEASVITEWVDIHFIDQSNGWVISSDGKIYRTMDGGANWIKEFPAVVEELRAIHMVSLTKGWIVGDNGLILTYTPL